VCTPFAPLSSKGNEDWWLYTPKCSGAIKNLLNNSNYTDKFYAHYYSYSEINFNLVVGFGNYAATDIRDRGNNTIINKNNNFYLSYWRDIAQSKPTDGNTNGDSWKYWFRYNYLIDRNICNFWSPDVEFDQLGSSIESIENIDFVGVAWIYKSYYSQSYNMKGWGTFYGSYTDNLGRAMWLKAVTKENFNIGVHDVKHTGNIDDDNTRISHIYESYFDSNISNYISFGSSSNYKIVKPKYIKNDIKATSYSCDSRLGEESILYNQLYDVTLVHSSLNYAGLMQYKLNSHLLFQLKQNSKYTSTQTGRLSLIPEFTYDNESTIDYNLWYSSVTYVCDLIKRSLVSGSRSYMWIADLVREVKNQYCDVNISNLSTQNWVPCGDRVALSSKAITVKFEEGDTFFQKYDCFRVSNIGNDVELNWQKIYEGFSLNLESYINLDGRWDSHRYEVGLSTSTFETFNKNNPVYSQLNNFFNYTAAGLQFNNSDSMPTTFIWSKPKVYGDQTDKSTGLWLTNSYTVDGIYGTINSIIKYNDELYGFQNSALFQINYNSRVQLSASDGVPIELGQSGKVSGVRYVSNTKGTTNKWSIVESIGGLFFIDGQYKDLCVFNSNGVTSISDKMSFKTWSRNNIYDYGEYGYNNINAFVSDSDLINDYVYFVNGNKCLKLNERMQCFESFVSHENTPFMFTCFDEFLSIRKNYNNLGNNKIWINYKGKKNIFYGSYVNSSITFFVNPDPANDKVFDNIQYRCDFYDQNGTYLPSKTFDSIYIQNEFQTSFFLPNSIVGNVFSNKKFRLWSFPFPRQTGTLNRIRNPWIKLSFNLTTNNDSSKIFFHDLFITYTI
jgi:hypothetical protein